MAQETVQSNNLTKLCPSNAHQQHKSTMFLQTHKHGDVMIYLYHRCQVTFASEMPFFILIENSVEQIKCEFDDN